MPLLTGSFRDVTAIRAHIPDAVFIADPVAVQHPAVEEHGCG